MVLVLPALSPIRLPWCRCWYSPDSCINKLLSCCKLLLKIMPGIRHLLLIGFWHGRICCAVWHMESTGCCCISICAALLLPTLVLLLLSWLLLTLLCAVAVLLADRGRRNSGLIYYGLMVLAAVSLLRYSAQLGSCSGLDAGSRGSPSCGVVPIRPTRW